MHLGYGATLCIYHYGHFFSSHKYVVHVLPTLNTFALFVVKCVVNIIIVHACPPLHHKYGFFPVMDMHMPLIQVPNINMQFVYCPH